jgi:transcriptional regulator with XRE-family HTH domain
MNPVSEDILMHYGVARRSGRYPWGSGEDPYQHGSSDLLSRVQECKNKGMSESEIAEAMGILNKDGKPSTTRLRAQISIATNERKMYEMATIKTLTEDGLSPTEIERKTGIPESTVRSRLKSDFESRASQAQKTADFLRDQINEKGMIDVGTGVERELGISKEKLNQALAILEEEGYPVYKGGIPQATNPGKQINQKVICPPGTEHKEIYNYDKIHTVTDYTSKDGGQTFETFQYPASLDSKRMKVRYAEDGGVEKDGIVEIRRGVKDLSLGDEHYSQVRILVDGTHYIKGMAVYADDLPKGVDIMFNTNKSSDVPMLGPKDNTVLKPIKKDDPNNPFGSLIKAKGQSTYTDDDGNEQLSLINKTRGEGDWTEWKDALPSQFLGKQSRYMAQKQLNLAKADKLAEYDEICRLNNPTVKKHLLQKFADECDSAAVHLQAAALPGQKYHVIIPVNSLKDNEVYAPRYEDGTQLALIRYPHGGTFEIPILTVNNKHAAAKKLIGAQSMDAVGINKKNADRLSGADFDGDTVMCIPTHDKAGKVRIRNKAPLAELEGFDPKESYRFDSVEVDANGEAHYYKNGKEFRVMKNTGTQMGIVSNLITDMTLAHATPSELARAVKHSMVVIDAEKHKLDWKQSEIDNNIAGLKKRYQPKYDEDGNVIGYGGAATILSRAKGETSVDKRQGTPKVNLKGTDWYDPSRPEGALIYKTADDADYQVTKVNKRTGEVTTVTKRRTQPSTNMAETDDAYTLVSGDRHPMELVYADYANSMKSLANQARVELATTGKITYSSTAKKVYQHEVDSLNNKLNTALLNTTRERAAQRKANAEVQAMQEASPNMKPGDVKKAKQQALSRARQAMGSVSRRDRNIEITDREWEAIQAGAVSENTLKKILSNTDTAKLRERATPRATSSLSTAEVARIKALAASNYTLAEISEKMGKSSSTVSKYLKGVN